MFKNIFSKKPKKSLNSETEEVLSVDTDTDENINISSAMEPYLGEFDFPFLNSSEEDITDIDPGNIEVSDEIIESSEVYDINTNNDREWEMLYAPEVVGWVSQEEQEILFNALILFFQPGQTVLDVGCGRADLFSLIGQSASSYKGIDYNPNILNIAKKKYPDINVESIDLLDYNDSELVDWVFASGLFNTQIENAIEYSQKCVDKMYENAKVGVAFNLLTGIPPNLSEEDSAQLIVWDSAAWLDYLVKKYKKIICRTDYMEGDTTFFIFK